MGQRVPEAERRAATRQMRQAVAYMKGSHGGGRAGGGGQGPGGGHGPAEGGGQVAEQGQPVARKRRFYVDDLAMPLLLAVRQERGLPGAAREG